MTPERARRIKILSGLRGIERTNTGNKVIWRKGTFQIEEFRNGAFYFRYAEVLDRLDRQFVLSNGLKKLPPASNGGNVLSIPARVSTAFDAAVDLLCS